MLTGTNLRSNEHLRGKTINIHEPRDVEHWASVLKCAKQDLIHAVLKIGHSAKMVDDFLILNRRKKTPNGQ